MSMRANERAPCSALGTRFASKDSLRNRSDSSINGGDCVNNKGVLADGKKVTLLRLLEKNPRAPISQLARRIRMSDPAVKERIFRLEESGILAGYRLELNPRELGYHVTAFVRVRPIIGHLNKIAELAPTITEITECHRVTGEDCFIVNVFLKEISHLDRVLDKFLAHGQTTTSIV